MAELAYIQAELFNMCLVFQIIGRSCQFLRTLEERSTAKNYCLVSLPFVISKVFQKLLKNRIVDHQKKFDLFSNFWYGFRCSWSTGDLLRAVSDRIDVVFNRPGATPAVALDKSKAFDRIWQTDLLQTEVFWDFRSDIWPCFFFSQ